MAPCSAHGGTGVRRGRSGCRGALLVVPLGLTSTALLGSSAGPHEGHARDRPSLVVAGDARAATELTCDGEADPPGSLPLTGRLEAARLCAIGPRHRRWTAPEPLADDLDGLAAALRGVCRTFLVSNDSAGEAEGPELWHPSPAAERILDDLRR